MGEWSPLVRLEGTTPHGISQSGLTLRAGRAYTGRVALAGTPGAAVSISLIWGPNPGDRQTVSVRTLTGRYAKVPLAFTARADTSDGRLEIAGPAPARFDIGVVSLMPADNVSGFKAATIKHLKDLGIEIARWPGGNFVSAYDWRDGIGDRDKRPPRRELAWNGMESNDMGVDDFMTFCRLIGAEPYLAVNSGLGDAHSAAEEVEYVNGPATSRLGGQRAANGHPAPYGVKIWGVGNEMYGPWQWGHMSIRQYAEKHNLMVRAMRQVDPTIKVIASGATPEEASWCYIENRQFNTFEGREKVSEPLPFAFGSSQDWTGALLKISADYIDYLGEHFYGYPNLVIDLAKEAFVESDEPLALKVRRLANRVQFKFEAWDEYVKRMPSLKDKDITFAFDEWSPRNRSLGTGPAPAGNPMLNPLTNALVYHEFFRHSDMVGLAVATGGMGTVASGHLRGCDRAPDGRAGHEAVARPLRRRAAGGRRGQLSPASGQRCGRHRQLRPAVGEPDLPARCLRGAERGSQDTVHLGGQSNRDRSGVRAEPDRRPGQRPGHGLPAHRSCRAAARSARAGDGPVRRAAGNRGDEHAAAGAGPDHRASGQHDRLSVRGEVG